MQSFDDLIVATFLIVVGIAISVVFYRSLSDPDPVTHRVRAFTRRRSWPRWVQLMAAILFDVVAVLVLVLFWVGVIDVTLFLVLPLERVRDALLLPYAIVAASRILTFITPSGARELAKTIPLALVVLLLLGEPLTAETLVAKAMVLEDQVPDDARFTLSVVILEFALRGLWRLRSRPLRATSATPASRPGRWTVTKRP